MSPIILIERYCLVRASLSEPHTTVTALQDACTCPVRTFLRSYTENLTNGYDFAHVLKLTPHCVTQG